MIRAYIWETAVLRLFCVLFALLFCVRGLLQALQKYALKTAYLKHAARRPKQNNNVWLPCSARGRCICYFGVIVFLLLLQIYAQRLHATRRLAFIYSLCAFFVSRLYVAFFVLCLCVVLFFVFVLFPTFAFVFLFLCVCCYFPLLSLCFAFLFLSLLSFPFPFVRLFSFFAFLYSCTLFLYI